MVLKRQQVTPMNSQTFQIFVAGSMRLALLTLCLSSVHGQTASDLETKYGKPLPAYVVSESIWMTPDYAPDGQVCGMRLYPKRIGPNTNYLTKELPFEELKEVLNQLVPPDLRGPKKEPFGQSATGGGAAWTTYTYGKVTFVFTSSFRVDPDAWKNSREYVFTVPAEPYDEERVKPTIEEEASADDFLFSKAMKTEIVTVRWKDRQCAKTVGDQNRLP